MKKILFRTGYLGLGAIEQLAFDIITSINDEYKVILAIENHKNNTLVEKLPEDIEYFYLKPKTFIEKMEKARTKKKKNIFYKLLYNYYLKKEKKVCLDSINSYIEEKGRIDLFIDYDGMALKYAKDINISKKIVWQHTAVTNEKNIKRMNKRLKSYDKVILICDEMKENFKKTFPELKDKFFKLYNFLDVERVRKMSLEVSNLSVEEKELMSNDYSVAIARLDEPKDFNTLIEAFKILKNKGIDEKLYIVGEGELRKEIENKLEEYNLKEKIILLGRKSNPYVWLKNANMFIHSSKREGLGIVLLEALALNKLVISSNCPVGPNEVLGNGKYGELYNVGDYKKLAETIENYLIDETSKETMLENSKGRIEYFEKKEVIKRYKNYFNEIMKG